MSPVRPLRPARPRALRGAAAVVLTLVLALAGCTGTGADEGTRSAGEQGFVGSSGTLTQVAPSQRVELPTVSGTTLDGEPLSTTDFRGQVLVVNVWGSWCAPCRQEAPALEQAAKETAGKAQFVGINSRDGSTDQAKAFARAFGITYPSLYDPSGALLLQFSGTLPPSAIPSTLVIDAQGRLAVRVLGEVTATTLVDMVDDVAAGR